MFEPTADGAHKVMRFVFGLTGKVPRTCPYATETAAATEVTTI
jgi:hypothetical protein